MLEITMVQLIGNLRVFLQYLVSSERASRTGHEVTHVGEVRIAMEKYLYVDCRWIWKICV